MAQVQIDEAKFRDVYEHPSIQRMLDELNPYQFEDFVGYVFTRAGFIVEDTATQYGPGLDLKLYTMPTAMKRLSGHFRQAIPSTRTEGPRSRCYEFARGTCPVRR